VDLIDPHCHLDLKAFADDRDAMLDRARAGGVRRFVVPSLHFRTMPGVLALAEQHPDIWAAIGVYPRYCDHWQPHDILRLRELARHPRVVAIGEIGLDYSFNNRCSRDTQATVFAAQLELAAEIDLPVIVHFWTRTSYDDTLRLIAESPLAGHDRVGVLDHFSADADLARRALDLGLHIGLAGRITYPNARKLPAVVAGLPLDRLVIATDAPAVPPRGHLGERNEPAYLPILACALAEIRGVSDEEVAAVTTSNATRLFWPNAVEAGPGTADDRLQSSARAAPESQRRDAPA